MRIKHVLLHLIFKELKISSQDKRTKKREFYEFFCEKIFEWEFFYFKIYAFNIIIIITYYVFFFQNIPFYITYNCFYSKSFLICWDTQSFAESDYFK